MPCRIENNFIPEIPKQRIDIIYLCYPNNPTGAVLSKSELKKWVNYAIENDALIIFDAAYERYIQDPDIPHSIYEIKGAKKVAIEFRSFSKTAGFTGVRCGYMVIPKEVTAATLEGKRIPLNKLWLRRQSTKFNGVSYITQRGAEAIYTPEGKEQVKAMVQYYMDNARIMKRCSRRQAYNFWRRKRSVSMDKSTGQPDFLEVLRQTSVRSTSGKHARSWFRPKRRRLCTSDLFRRTPSVRRRHPANLPVSVNKTTCKYRNQIT